MIAALPMYDWPEHRAETDALWERMRDALLAEGFDAPATLTRDQPLQDLWTSSDLLLAETCSWPLATALNGEVRYVATLLRDALGCEDGIYRSAIVARTAGRVDVPVPAHAEADLPPMDGMTLAYNNTASLSGYVALKSDTGSSFGGEIETGSHRCSIITVAEGQADVAAIDAYTWHLARRYEPAAQQLSVIGWTAWRPALPLITAQSTSDDDLRRMRHAILCAVPAIVHEDPLNGLEPSP